MDEFKKMVTIIKRATVILTILLLSSCAREARVERFLNNELAPHRVSVLKVSCDTLLPTAKDQVFAMSLLSLSNPDKIDAGTLYHIDSVALDPLAFAKLHPDARPVERCVYASVIIDGVPARCAVYYGKDTRGFSESSLKHKFQIYDIIQLRIMSK